MTAVRAKNVAEINARGHADLKVAITAKPHPKERQGLSHRSSATTNRGLIVLTAIAMTAIATSRVQRATAGRANLREVHNHPAKVEANRANAEETITAHETANLADLGVKDKVETQLLLPMHKTTFNRALYFIGCAAMLWLTAC